jgi:aspartate aminotransferase
MTWNMIGDLGAVRYTPRGACRACIPAEDPMFEMLETLPADPILGLATAYREDPSPDKVDLSVGVYRNRAGQTPVMEAVIAAERSLIEQQLTKAYLPAAGAPAFREGIFQLVLGSGAAALRERSAVIQAPGGCGALRLGAELIQRAAPGALVQLGDPTWPNHGPLLAGGGLALARHPYYDASRHVVDLQPMLAALEQAPEGCLVLLQASSHNPTGADPDRQQWEAILDVVAHRRLVPFFDIAYQGLGDDLDADAWSIRRAAERVPEMLVAVSCSKCFGLYRERTGALIVLGADGGRARAIESQANKAARAMYSMPPGHGALIAERILGDATLTANWRAELAAMAARLRSLRTAFVAAVKAARPDADIDWLAGQRGMFSLLGLKPEAVRELREQHHIYMGLDSRINIAGLSEDNVGRVAELVAPHL